MVYIAVFLHAGISMSAYIFTLVLLHFKLHTRSLRLFLLTYAKKSVSITATQMIPHLFC